MKKLWKVTVKIVHEHIDGNGISSTETECQYFEDFNDAKVFARSGYKLDPWTHITDARIVEYSIDSERELKKVKKEELCVTTRNTETWE